MRAILIAGFLAFLSAGSAQGPEGTAVVRGRVVDALSGKPLPQLTVRFSPQPRGSYAPGITPQPPNRTAITGADGTFEVPRLVPADYSIYADARGEYLPIQYGGSSATGRKLLEVGENARLDITIRAWRGATIEGHVFDERGRPIIGAQVRVFADDPSVYGSASTDDRGAYQIARLRPGRYAVGVAVGLWSRTVSGTPGRESPYRYGMGGFVLDRALRTVLLSQNAPFPPAADDGRPRVFETAFAGGGRTKASATKFRLEAGDVRSDTDITLTAVRGTRIAGVVSAPGKVDGTILTLTRPGASGPEEGSIQATAAKDGTFVFVAVPPGSYTLTGRRRNPPLTEVTLAGGSPYLAMDDVILNDGDAASLRMPLAVGDADVDDLVLALRPGTPVIGRVVVEDAGPPQGTQREQVRIQLAPAEASQDALDDRYLQIGRDGSQTVRLEPGSYRILSRSGMAGRTFRTAIVNGIEIGDGPLLVGDEPIADLQFVFARLDTMLRGAIVDSSGNPVARATVVIFPVDRARWFRLEESNHGRSIEVTNGQYQVAGMLPGDYYAIALDSLQAPLSPVTLEPLIPSATRVSLRTGTPLIISLTILGDRK